MKEKQDLRKLRRQRLTQLLHHCTALLQFTLISCYFQHSHCDRINLDLFFVSKSSQINNYKALNLLNNVQIYLKQSFQ